MARSVKKGPFVDDHLVKKVDAAPLTREYIGESEKNLRMKEA